MGQPVTFSIYQVWQAFSAQLLRSFIPNLNPNLISSLNMISAFPHGFLLGSSFFPPRIHSVLPRSLACRFLKTFSSVLLCATSACSPCYLMLSPSVRTHFFYGFLRSFSSFHAAIRAFPSIFVYYFLFLTFLRVISAVLIHPTSVVDD